MAINLAFDTETTGLTKHPLSKDEVQPHIIEFAGIKVDSDGVVIDERVWLIKPPCEISEEITNITGITNEMLAEAPQMADVIDDILTFMEADQIIAHNLTFDLTMLEFECSRHSRPMPTFDSYLCTVEENEPFYGFRPRLTLLYEDVIGKPLDQTHRALDDVNALIEVCNKTGVLKYWPFHI